MEKRLSVGDILFKILKCLIVFYPSYYAVGSICFASYSLEVFDGKIPFDFHHWIDFSNCCMGYPADQLVNVISMEITYSLSGVIFGIFIDRWVWDYAITITVVHIALSCLVMLDFPLIWSWWVCLGIGLSLMTSFGESVAFVRRKRAKMVTVFPENNMYGNNNGSYLYKS